MATSVHPINFNPASIPTPSALHKTPLLKIPPSPTTLREVLLSLTHNLGFSITNKSSDGVYSMVLDRCATENSLSLGKQIHTHIIKRNNASDLAFLSTKLVYMYGKCGSLLDAEEVFDEMPVRSVFTYNAMLGAYVSNGEFQKAIELYSDMRFCDTLADGHTCSCVLKACAAVEEICCGRKIHGYATKLGLICCNDIVVNALVNMYASSGDVTAAELLFERSGKGNAVSFNLMISSYVASGMRKEALRVFVELLDNAVTPSTYTFVAALQACGELSSGMQIHAVVLKHGSCYDRHVANALVAMYATCGRIDEAARVFVDVDDRDRISWNTMLDAYVQNGLFDESLDFFRGMVRSGQKPDQVSVISVLSACGRSGNLLNGMEAHAFTLKNGMEMDCQVGNTVTDMYAKCSKTNFMGSAFRRIHQKDLISWATLMAGYVQNYCYTNALQAFKEVQVETIDIDEMMIECVLLACHGLKCLSKAKEAHGYTIRRGLSDIVLQNTFVNVYGECGEVNYARCAFDLIEVKNVVSWTSMITCYIDNGLANQALEISYHTVKSGVDLDIPALLSIVSAAANSSLLRKGKEIHGFLVRRCLHFGKSIASSLVDMYASCGAVDKAYDIFKCVKDKDLVLYTSMINAYGLHGQGRAAIELFGKLEDENLRLDHITFLALLRACSHSALVDEGKRYFNAMQCQYNLEPWPEHHACLVDLLGRANCLEEAFELVKRMNMEPPPAVWCALLGACKTHFNVEIGEIAAMKLLEMEPESPGNYVLVSNVYAAAERWEDVEKVRTCMKDKGLKKEPGCSWIEIGNKVHTFITRDRSHPQSDEIYEKLNDVIEKLERDGGYTAQTSFVLHNVEEAEKVKMLHGHSERLALAYGLLNTPTSVPIRITKNLRVCGDCHAFTKLVSKIFDREIIVRDANRFHHFRDGACSCQDFW